MAYRALMQFLQEDPQVPVFKNSIDVVVRGIKVFLRVEAGATRDGVAEPALRRGGASASGVAKKNNPRVRKLERAGQRIVREGRALGIRARRRLGGEEAGGIRPENVVWIFGSARTGST